MTPEEYASPHLFPLTTQEGLDLSGQLQLDAVNYDEYVSARRRREALDERERAVGRELETKHAARASVLRAAQQGPG